MSLLAEAPPALANLRVLPVPCADPPYDRLDADTPARPADRAEQHALPLLFVLPSGVPAQPELAHSGVDPVFDRQPTRTQELPDVHSWAGRLSRAAVEVQVGSRPVAQLRRWLSDDVYEELLRSRRRALRVAEPRRRDERRPPRVVLRAIRTCEVADGIVEACAVVDDGRRVWALALRLEGSDGRWRCTALQKVTR